MGNALPANLSGQAYGSGYSNVGSYNPKTMIWTGSVGVSYQTDYTYNLSNQPGTGSIETDAWKTFHNGAAPLQIFNFQLSANAEWINGGGSPVAPITSPTVYAAILLGDYPSAPSLSDPSVMAGAIVPSSINGNGMYVLPQTTVGVLPTSPSTYVIGPNQDYTLWLRVNTSFDNSNYNVSEPVVTIQNVSGAHFQDGYNGYSLNLNFATVPEPSTIVLAAVAVLALLSFLRRSCWPRWALLCYWRADKNRAHGRSAQDGPRLVPIRPDDDARPIAIYATREAMRFTAFLLVTLVAASAQLASANPGLVLDVIAGNYGNSLSYSAAAIPTFFLGDPGFPYQTGVIQSADHQYVATANGGWGFQEPSFKTFGDLIASLNESWTITFDKGLPTEKDYTTKLDLGTWPQIGLGIPSINIFPSGSGTFNTTMPTIPMTLPSQSSDVDVRLVSPPITGTILFDDFVPNTTTLFHINPTLVVGHSYSLNIYALNISLPVAFSVPVDAGNVPMPGTWQTGGHADTETGITFTIVPEPQTVTLLIPGAAIGLAALARKRFGRLRA